MQVFLSVGRVSTDQQKAFLERLETKLRNRGLEPRTIGRNTFTAGSTMERIVGVMGECHGLIVFAFERTCVEKGYELQPAGEDPEHFEKRRFASPWHHIEIALAQQLQLPTLTIIEKGIHEEGLLEDKYGWYQYRTRLDAAALESDELNGIIDDWTARVKTAKRAKIDVADLTMGDLVKNLKPGQLWAVLGAIVVLLSGAFGIGTRFRTASDKKEPVSPAGVLIPPTKTDVVAPAGPQGTQQPRTDPAPAASGATGSTGIRPSSPSPTSSPRGSSGATGATGYSGVSGSTGRIVQLRDRTFPFTHTTTMEVAAPEPELAEVRKLFAKPYCSQSEIEPWNCSFDDLPSCTAALGAVLFTRSGPDKICVKRPDRPVCFAYLEAIGNGRMIACSTTAADCEREQQSMVIAKRKGDCKQFTL